MTVSPPGEALSLRYHTASLSLELGRSLMTALTQLLPWKRTHLEEFSTRFRVTDRVFPGTKLDATELYRNHMKPEGLPPVWPIGHSVCFEGSVGGAVIAVFRRSGSDAFGPEDLAFGDRLVPHLARAFAIYRDLGEIHRERRALEELVDRLQVGVILVDSARRPVLTNRSADRMIALDEGIRVIDGRVCARDPKDDPTLQTALENAVKSASRHEFHSLDLFTLSAPPNRRQLQVMVNPLLAAPPGSALRAAMVAILIANPDEVSASSAQILRSLYALTEAESELVQLLIQGETVEAAARQRGVTVNTARSQLKQIFARTGTRRQSELIQFILGGIASIRAE